VAVPPMADDRDREIASRVDPRPDGARFFK
jgi:hypothetical protein